MEYNLLKTIEPNLGLQMCPMQNPHLTPYPAIDYVNPGLGQAARLFSFYVPLHTNQSPFAIEKKENNAVLQEGGSKDSEFNETESNHDNDDPIEFNNRKRKLMGDAIQSSFMHPIVTDTIQLEPESKVKKKNIPTNSEAKKRQIKHKFQFH
jgi:hypothetical protein